MRHNEPQVSGWRRTLSNWVAADIVLSWALAAVVYLLSALDLGGGLRFAIVAPALFLLPGYVTVAAIYPRTASQHAAGPFALDAVDRVGARERLALSFGLSVALLPLLGVAIGLSPWTFSETAAARAFVAFVGLVGLVAAMRRRRVVPEDRYRLPLATWSAEARASLTRGPTVDRALNLALVLAVVLALGTIGYALAVPPAGEGFTNFAVLTEQGDELVAGGYPEDLAPGQSASLVTAVENREGQPQEYTVVVTVERPSTGQPDEAAEEVELQRFGETVQPGERWTRTHEVTPELTGENLRVNYYLYRGEAPAEPDASSADHHLYFWTSVGAAGSA